MSGYRASGWSSNPFGVAVGAAEGLVAVQHGLHDVFPGRDVGEAVEGIAEGGSVEGGALAGGQPIDVHAKDLLGFDVLTDQRSRLGLAHGGEDQEQAAVERVT
jgi:hypothetical protein